MDGSGGRSRSKASFFPAELPRIERPRTRGLTELLDRVEGTDPGELAILSAYLDVARFDGLLPLLIPRDRLRERIRAYHDLGVDVSTSREMMEVATARERVPQFLDEARAIGFDLIEAAAGRDEGTDFPLERFARSVSDRGLGLVVQVGGRDTSRSASLQEIVRQIARARLLGPRRISLPAPAEGRAGGIYDADTGIKYDWLRAIVSDRPHDDLLFEAPLESQQSYLLRELGPNVNLGGVALAAVAGLAMQRLTLANAAPGGAARGVEIGGPPAAKFLYFLLEQHRGLDQGQLTRLSRLPRRTVQSALDSLQRQGLVKPSIVLHDSRRREYRIA
ncbi:MAG TPA: phosphosulfolactate synthase [Thermoplasmata archaeon]|nr:phosphosulfolactate synthase [Thermoplasmata archaeon]